MLPAAENSASNEVEQEIWALEEIYMTAFEEADHEVILDLLHDRFLGWPRESELPTEKSESAKFLKENYPEPLELSFEINRAGIRVSGDVAITHYTVMIGRKDGLGAGPTHTVRITHTWIREGSGWRILGGMSGTAPGPVR
jgi:ketosteroid isomerase-like protein